MLKNRRFNHPSLIVVRSVGWVKRRVSAATGCSAPLSSHFRAGADARLAVCGQAAGRGHEPTRRRAWRSVDDGGYQGEALVELEGRGFNPQRQLLWKIGRRRRPSVARRINARQVEDMNRRVRLTPG